MTALTANLARQTVRSADGTTLSYYSTGRGPAVILIPGALLLASDYAVFAEALGQQFTVHTLERRGHGESGPQGEQYSLRRECEDVNALQAATGATRLVGHSFGGLVALEVARQTSAFCQVAVYEPGVSINGSISMAWVPGYQQKLARRQYAQAFVEYALATGPDRARRTPPWLMQLLLPLFVERAERETMLKLLPENLREHQALAAADSSYENYRAITAEVLLLSGGQTGSAWVTLAMERLLAILPASQAKVFPKLDHFGINKKAPVEIAAAVSEFFQQSRAQSAITNRGAGD